MQDIDELAPKWLSSKTIQLYNKRIVNIYSHILCSQENMYFSVYNINVVHTNGKNSLLAWFLSGLFDFYNGYPLKGYN